MLRSLRYGGCGCAMLALQSAAGGWCSRCSQQQQGLLLSHAGPSLGCCVLLKPQLFDVAAERQIEAGVERVCATRVDRRAITVTSAEQSVQRAWICGLSTNPTPWSGSGVLKCFLELCPGVHVRSVKVTPVETAVPSQQHADSAHSHTQRLCEACVVSEHVCLVGGLSMLSKVRRCRSVQPQVPNAQCTHCRDVKVYPNIHF